MQLITGGYGLIGSEFKNGYRVSRRDYDLQQLDQVNQMFEKYQPDQVIHTAAVVGGVLGNSRYLHDFFLHNIRINTNIIDAAQRYGVKKLLAFSSTCVFPDSVQYPLKEEYQHQGPPHPSNFGYAYAKRMVDIQIQACNQQFGTRYFSAIPTNVYGPNDVYDQENGHVVPSLIAKCVAAKENQTPLEVWGAGRAMREFIYSADVANICEILMDRYQQTDPVIISTGQEVSIQQLVETIADIVGLPRSRIQWNQSMPEGQLRKPTNISKLQNIVGAYDFVSLNDGLEKTIEHYFANRDSLRSRILFDQ